MRTSLRQKQGDKSHNIPQPRAFWEGRPSAACISQRFSLACNSPLTFNYSSFSHRLFCSCHSAALLLSFVNYSKRLISNSFTFMTFVSSVHLLNNLLHAALPLTQNLWLCIHLKPSTVSLHIDLVLWASTSKHLKHTVQTRRATVQLRLHKICIIAVRLKV